MSEATFLFPKHYLKIKQRSCYQVGYKLYKTPRAAAKAQAWSLILTKYVVWPGVANKLSEVKKVLLMECDCCADYFGEYGTQYGHEACPLHDRYNGYFARLHKRLSGALLKNYEIQLTTGCTLTDGDSAIESDLSTPEGGQSPEGDPNPPAAA